MSYLPLPECFVNLTPVLHVWVNFISCYLPTFPHYTVIAMMAQKIIFLFSIKHLKFHFLNYNTSDNHWVVSNITVLSFCECHIQLILEHTAVRGTNPLPNWKFIYNFTVTLSYSWSAPQIQPTVDESLCWMKEAWFQRLHSIWYHLQLTLGQHRFELHWSTYTCIFH